MAQVNVFGAAAYAVRLQMDPTALAARNIGIDQVASAVQQANVNIATGTLNGATQGAQSPRQRPAHSLRAAWSHQIVAWRNDAPVRIADIGRAIDSYQNILAATWYNGKRAIVLSIQRQPGSNTIQIVDLDQQRHSPLCSDPPEFGPSHHSRLSISQSIRASVADVQMTLLIA